MIWSQPAFLRSGLLQTRASLAGLAVLLLSGIIPLSAEAKLNLGVSSTNYMGQGPEGRPNSFSTFDLHLDARTSGDWVDSRSWVQSEIAFNDSSYRFIEVPELYLATSRKLLAPAQFTLGRKLQNWSFVDETWGTGIFQPQFRWDYLRPQPVGLTGFYQEFHQGPVQVTLFYSPLFVPDRGAPLDFSDGQIRSISPWVVNPPYEIEIMRKQVPIRYEARVPPLGEIVRQNTLAGRIAVGERTGIWGATAYAYKPMNQLLMSYEADVSTRATDAGTANVVLYPRVAYHHVATADLGYRSKQFSSTLSFMADLPKDDFESSTRVNQQVGNFYSVSPTLRYGVMALSYLRVFGEDLADTGPSILVDGKTSEFDSRYPYKNAFLFSTALPTWNRLSTDFKILVDIENLGTIVSWNFQYSPEKNWRISLATDVLSSFSEEGDGTNFINRYRENDRITGGVTYVF